MVSTAAKAAFTPIGHLVLLFEGFTMHTLNKSRALALGYSADKRKRRRQHRKSAKHLSCEGGKTIAFVASWHRAQARWI